MINEYLNNWSLNYINLVILAIVSKQIYTLGRCDDWVTALIIIVHKCVYANVRICGRWKLIKPLYQIPDIDSLERSADLTPIGSLRTIIPLFILKHL